MLTTKPTAFQKVKKAAKEASHPDISVGVWAGSGRHTYVNQFLVAELQDVVTAYDEMVTALREIRIHADNCDVNKDFDTIFLIANKTLKKIGAL